MINLSNRKFSKDEYKRIWDEENERIEFAYNFSNRTIKSIFAFWSIIFTIVGICIETIKEPLFLVSVLFVLSIFVISPISILISIKNKIIDNASALVSLVAYSKVFYEAETIIFENNNLKLWESIHVNVIPKRIKFLDNEVSILALISLIISFLIISFLLVYSIINSVFDNYEFLAIIYSVIFSFVFIIGVLMTIMVCLSGINKIFKECPQQYMFYYLKIAYDSQLYKLEEIEKYLNFLDAINDYIVIEKKLINYNLMDSFRNYIKGK